MKKICMVLLLAQLLVLNFRDSFSMCEIKPINKAAALGNIKEMQELLDQGISIEESDYFGTPLHYSISHNQEAMTTFLLEHKANAESEGPFGQTPLHYAAMLGNINIARSLIESGANIERVNDLRETSLSVAVSAVPFIAEISTTKKRALGIFARHTTCNDIAQRKEFAKLLLQHGAKINPTNSKPPLWELSILVPQYYPMAEFLVSLGADPYLEWEGKNCFDRCTDKLSEILKKERKKFLKNNQQFMYLDSN